MWTELLQRPELEDALIFGGGVHAKGNMQSLKGNPEGRKRKEEMKEETQISTEGSQQIGAIGKNE